MRKASFKKILGKCGKRMVYILFETFSLKKWLILLLIAWLAGSASFGLGGGGGFDNDSKKTETTQEEELVETTASDPQQKQTPSQPADDQEDAIEEEEEYSFLSFLSTFSESRSRSILIVAALVFFCGAFFVFVLFFWWIQSRFRFVWLDSILYNNTLIVKPFSKYREQGNSLFVFTALFWLATFSLVMIDIMWIFYRLYSAGAFKTEEALSASAYFHVLGLPIGFLLMVLFVSYLILIIVIDFIVPIMAHDMCRVVGAFVTCGKLMVSHMKDFFLYYIIRFALTFLLGLAISILILLCFLLVAVLAAVFIGIPYIVLVLWLQWKFAFVMIAMLLGIFLAVAALAILFSPSLPFAVLYRTYPLYFLASLDVGYDLVEIEKDLKE